MNKIRFIFIVLIIFKCSLFSYAYDDRITHPEITKNAVKSSKVGNYLKQNLGNQFSSGTETIVNGIAVLDWLTKGSTDEDTPNCRASNHFHNPLLPWDQSYMSDDVTPVASKIRDFCNVTGWPYLLRKSNVTWATGYLSPAPEGKTKASFTSERNYALYRLGKNIIRRNHYEN